MNLTNFVIIWLTSLILEIQIKNCIGQFKHLLHMEYIKSAYKNNKFKISDPTWNDEFDLPDGSYFLSDMKDYYEYIIKKHENIEDISPIEIYINKIKTRFVFKIKANYKLKLLSKEARKLRRSTEKVIVKDKNDEHVLK